MACNVPRQVAASYKTLRTKAQNNAAHRTQRCTRKRYKGLDKPPRFTALTVPLNHRRDYSIGEGQTLSIGTIDGRVRCHYVGWTKHLDWLRQLEENGVTLGAAKLWQDPISRVWYLLVSIEKILDTINVETLQKVKGVDLNRRNIAVETDMTGKCWFYQGGYPRHLAAGIARTRSALQAKGTRGARWLLGKLALRERRLNANTTHCVSKAIAEPHAMVGMEWLKDIRERTERPHRKKSSIKQRKANRRASSWSFAEIQSKTAYKTRMVSGLPVWVDADYTSQMCPQCGHTSRENRPEHGLLFICTQCGHTLHADLVASRNISLRTFLIRQDWIRTGRLSAAPEAPGNETKAVRLQKYTELRWSPCASSTI